MSVDLYRESLDLFCAWLGKSNAEILDVGCGPGNITKYLLTKQPAFQILGLDLAPTMLELARANNPTAELRTLDCRTIGALPTQYHGIVLGFCLPYLSKQELMYINYHQADYLTAALDDSGFALLDLSRKTYASANGATTTDLLIVARLSG